MLQEDRIDSARQTAIPVSVEVAKATWYRSKHAIYSFMHIISIFSHAANTWDEK
jgi:hypothetical protein